MVRLLLDANISARVSSALNSLWIPKDGPPVRHMGDIYGVTTRDEDFLPRLTADGWCLVTYDNRQRHDHAALLLEHNVTALYLDPGRRGRTALMMLRDLLVVWPDVVADIVPRFTGAGGIFMVRRDELQDVTEQVRANAARIAPHPAPPDE